jgi:hypothetical protein
LLLPGGPVDVADALEGEHQNFVPRDQNQRGALAILGARFMCLSALRRGYFSFRAAETVKLGDTRAWGAVRWVPGGGSLDPADRIENTSSFDGVGRADTHDLHLRIHFIFGWIYCGPSAEAKFSFESGGFIFT